MNGKKMYRFYMFPLEKTILIVAVVALIISLTVVGIVLSKTSNYSPLPTPSCPDFWYNTYYAPCINSQYGCCSDKKTTMTDASGSNCGIPCNTTQYGCCSDGITSMLDASGSNCAAPEAKCYNTHGLGNTDMEGCMSQDFTTDDYTGSAGLCNKQTWAKQCNVSWDGVTNVGSTC
jgi:hypothetical protein